MTTRVLAAALAAVGGMTLTFTTTDIAARPAGVSGRPMIAHPLSPRAAARPFLPARKSFSSQRMLTHKHRHSRGNTIGWGGGGWGSYYDPTSHPLLPPDLPAENRPAAQTYLEPAPISPMAESPTLRIRVVPVIYEYRPGCQSQAQPVEDGARVITIMRC